MYYTLYNIPGITPGDILNASISALDTYKLTSPGTFTGPEFYGTSGSINVDARVTPTLVAISNGTGANALQLLYYVTNLYTTQVGTALDLEFAATQTLVSNNPGYFRQNRWTLSRYSPKDTVTNTGNTSELDALYRQKHVKLGQLQYSGLNSYACVVTAYTEAFSTASARTLWVYGGYKSSDPQSYVMTDSNGNMLTGDTAIGRAGYLVNREVVRPFLYRIQLIPSDFASLMINTGVAVQQFRADPDETFPIHGRLLQGYERTTAAMTVNFSEIVTTDIANLKAYGDPVMTFEYGGNALARLPVFSTATNDHNFSDTKLYLGATCNMGVNSYIRVKQNSVSVALFAFPFPELIGTATGVNAWYESTGRNLLTSAWVSGGLAVVGGVAAIATGGAAAPILGGLALSTVGTATTTALSYSQGMQSAERTLLSVGGGSTSFYATSDSTNALEIYADCYSKVDVSTRDYYFRRNGYPGAWSLTSLPLSTPPRAHYWCVQGEADVAMIRTQSTTGGYNVPVSSTEFRNALNAEVGAGVTIWETDTTIGDYSTGNTPTS